MTLSAIFYPCHFVRTILSIPFCPIPFCPYTILSIPFCPYYFVRYHFVLEPYIGLHRICPVTAIGPVELFKLQSPIFPSFSKSLHLCLLMSTTFMSTYLCLPLTIPTTVGYSPCREITQQIQVN